MVSKSLVVLFLVAQVQSIGVVMKSYLTPYCYFVTPRYDWSIITVEYEVTGMNED